MFRIQQEQQRAREVAALKISAAVPPRKAAVTDGSDNWETF
ncbi:chemotaxis protein [Salmonella enterica subsp. enterica]|nr:chemotaxis protein [Salmonella enterica subsp. enterica]